MNVLILTSEIGGGHISATAALVEEFEREGHTVDVIDAIDALSKAAGYVVESGHDWFYRHAPKLFNFGYGIAETRHESGKEKQSDHHSSGLGRKKMLHIICEGHYDAVLCTHVFPAAAISGDASLADVQTSFLSTDYTCSLGVEDIDVDWYFIPDESLVDEFADKGVPREKIVPVGMPVRDCFLSRTDKTEARLKVGFNPEEKHLLVMCGSMGGKPMKEIVEKLAEDIPENIAMTLCCGTNESLYRKFSQQFGHRRQVRVMGYTDLIPDLMDSADLFLSKAGGLSISEAMNKRLPLCLVNSIDGWEMDNTDFFVRNGMAVKAKDPDEISDTCIRLLNDDVRLNEMSLAMDRKAPENAARAIVTWMADHRKC